MFYNIKIGKLGQEIAVRFLESKNYKILAQNIYFREGEIDILVEKEDVLIFIEVKTRTNSKFGYPEDSISDQKKEHLELAINRYIAENNINQECVLEIISVRLDLKNKKAYLKHFV